MAALSVIALILLMRLLWRTQDHASQATRSRDRWLALTRKFYARVEKKQLPAAERVLARALKVASRTSSAHTRATLCMKARFCLELDRRAEAIQLFQEVLKGFELNGLHRTPDAVRLSCEVAAVHLAKGEVKEATAVLEKARDATAQWQPGADAEYARAIVQVGSYIQDLSIPGALDILERARRMTRGMESTEPELVRINLQFLGSAYRDAERYAEAAERFRECLSVHQLEKTNDPLLEARILAALADCELRDLNYADAEAAARQALAIRREKLPPNDSGVTELHCLLTWIHTHQARWADAGEALQHWIEALPACTNEDRPLAARALSRYARYMRSSGADYWADMIETRICEISPELRQFFRPEDAWPTMRWN